MRSVTYCGFLLTLTASCDYSLFIQSLILSSKVIKERDVIRTKERGRGKLGKGGRGNTKSHIKRQRTQSKRWEGKLSNYNIKWVTLL